MVPRQTSASLLPSIALVANASWYSNKSVSGIVFIKRKACLNAGCGSVGVSVSLEMVIISP